MRSTARPLAGNHEATEADPAPPDTSRNGPQTGETPRSIALSRRRTLGRRLSDWLDARGVKRLVLWAGAVATLVVTLAALG